MVKVKVIEKFDLKDFKALKNIVRADLNKNQEGKLYENDTFECDEKMTDYLTGNNPLKKKVVEIIEVKSEEEIIEEKKEDDEENLTFRRSKKRKK